MLMLHVMAPVDRGDIKRLLSPGYIVLGIVPELREIIDGCHKRTLPAMNYTEYSPLCGGYSATPTTTPYPLPQLRQLSECLG